MYEDQSILEDTVQANPLDYVTEFAGLKHGIGFYSSPPITYFGTFFKDVYHGYGILNTDKAIYEGFFENGKFQGRGILYEINKKGILSEPIIGIWKRGKLVKSIRSSIKKFNIKEYFGDFFWYYEITSKLANVQTNKETKKEIYQSKDKINSTFAIFDHDSSFDDKQLLKNTFDTNLKSYLQNLITHCQANPTDKILTDCDDTIKFENEMESGTVNTTHNTPTETFNFDKPYSFENIDSLKDFVHHVCKFMELKNLKRIENWSDLWEHSKSNVVKGTVIGTVLRKVLEGSIEDVRQVFITQLTKNVDFLKVSSYALLDIDINFQDSNGMSPLFIACVR